MKQFISLNGLDKSGKSTQAQRINSHYCLSYLAGKLKDYPDWPKVSELSNWWFFDGRTEDVLTTLWGAVSFRDKIAREQSYPLIVIDRGSEMFESVCIATAMVRDNSLEHKARTLFERVKNKFPPVPNANEAIFYSTGNTPEEMILTSDSRKREQEGTQRSQKIYACYQRILAELLLKQIAIGKYSRVINANKPVDDVFKETKQSIDGAFVSAVDTSNLELLVGLGGLSESGKSSFGLYLQNKRGFYRVKIDKVIQAVGQSFAEQLPSGLDIYSVSDELLATLFLERLNEYAHDKSNYVVIESLRNPGATRFIKKVMGTKFKIVYVSTPLDIRILRNIRDVGTVEISKEEVARKDKIKMKKGAHTIEGFSDFILDNTGTFEEGYKKLDGFLGL